MSLTMQPEVVQKLLDVNRSFYDRLSGSFAESRVKPQPGFFRLLPELPQPCRHLLDVGCGDGRLGRFCFEHQAIQQYTGVDFSAELLAIAAAGTPGEFLQRDMSQPDALSGLGQFEAVACLAALQHVPGLENRRRLLAEMGGLLAPGGRLLISTWQFLNSPRLRRKVRAWTEIELHQDQVEAGDYLLTWERDGFAYRYVALIDETQMADLARTAGLQVVNQFHSDGKEGNLGLYTILAAA